MDNNNEKSPELNLHLDLKDVGGVMSLLKYKEATASSADEKERSEATTWLREYNLDDIRATFAVRNYIVVKAVKAELAEKLEANGFPHAAEYVRNN
jgi:hypothetical protein